MLVLNRPRLRRLSRSRPFASRLGGLSFLSQVADHPAVQFGRQNSRPFSSVADVAEVAPRKLLISSTIPEVLRGALVYRNTANFRPFPDDRTYLWVVQFYGANPGSVYPLPLEAIAANYRLIEDKSSERKVYGNIPLPIESTNKYDITHFVGTIDDGLFAASDALEKAKAGDLTEAQNSLADAISKRDDSRMTLTLLWSLFWINDEVYNELYERVFKKVDGDVNEAAQVIQSALEKGAVEKSAANSLQARIKADSESIAGTLSDFAQILLDDLSVSYWLTVLANRDLRAYMNVLKARGASARFIESVQRSFNFGMAHQLKMEVDLQGMGLTASEIKEVASISDLDQGLVKGFLRGLKLFGKIFRKKAAAKIGERWTIPVIGEAAETAEKVRKGAKVAQISKTVAVSGWHDMRLAIGFGILVPLASLYFIRPLEFKKMLEEQRKLDEERRKEEEQRRDEERKREESEAAQAAQRTKDILEATRDILNNYKRQLAEVPSSDPVIAGLNDEADLSLAEITAALGESDLLPYVLLGAGLFGIGLYFYFKNR